MLDREIPFRPRLEGDFRIRFYNAVSNITQSTPLTEIEGIAETEINWVTNKCTVNLDQRKKYRAVWYLFRDLIHASWTAFYRDGVLYAADIIDHLSELEREDRIFLSLLLFTGMRRGEALGL